jgi:hypothetical protein
MVKVGMSRQAYALQYVDPDGKVNLVGIFDTAEAASWAALADAIDYIADARKGEQLNIETRERDRGTVVKVLTTTEGDLPEHWEISCYDVMTVDDVRAQIQGELDE